MTTPKTTKNAANNKRINRNIQSLSRRYYAEGTLMDVMEITIAVFKLLVCDAVGNSSASL